MKKTYLLMAVLALAACSPRVDDVFDGTAVVRMEQNKTVVQERLISARNGWVMQYFAQSDNVSSSVEKHQGYTFIMRFFDDGTVTIGAPVDGVYKTETSMWDVISDNSTVLTFNTFNSIFHYYSNPDPDLGLWGSDGTGVGGDYEFLVLEYNQQENYQLLKGKKRSCYVRMYPLDESEDWEGYFDKIAAMENRLFPENVPWDMYVGDKHLTLYNGLSHEFRVFEYGADTLGGGSYYGFIITDKGIRLHDETILGAEIDRASFNLTADGRKLQSVVDPSTYITVEGATAFVSDANNAKPWNIDMSTLPEQVKSSISGINTNISQLVRNSSIKSLHFYGAGNNRVGLRIYYIVGGDAGNSYDTYYFDVLQDGDMTILTADGTYTNGSILYNYGALDLLQVLSGQYTSDLIQGFAPSKGIQMSKDADFVITLRH